MTSTHGDAGAVRTSEYESWVHMRQRCLNPMNARYSYYGGRGITICERWSSYEHFLADMGRRPSREYSLDRINNEGNYEPGNCRWATTAEQNANRSWKRCTDRCAKGRHLWHPGSYFVDVKGHRRCRACQVEGRRKRRAQRRAMLHLTN